MPKTRTPIWVHVGTGAMSCGYTATPVEPSAAARLAAERSELIDHLHAHPDHAGRYRAGHDFVLVSTADIARDHRRQHGEGDPPPDSSS